MSITEYIELILAKLKEAKEDNRTDDFLILLTQLKETIDEQLKNFYR